MKRLALLFLLPLGLQAQALTRRPLSLPAKSGWAVVTLDAEAQRQHERAWISDDGGRPIPFQEVRAGARAGEVTPAPRLRLGRDGEGRPTAAFELPRGGGRTLRLQVEAKDRPWVARALLQRQGPGGVWILWDPRPRPHAWQLGYDEGLAFDLPDEPGPWRLTLKPVVGRAPRLLGLTLSAPAEPWTLQEEVRLPLALVPMQTGLWRLTLPAGESLKALDVHVRAPAAPLRAELLAPSSERPQDPAAAMRIFHEGALWALPALESESATLTLSAPFEGNALFLRLPPGAEPERVEGRVHRAALRLPVEQGRRYWLHLGGDARMAPGDLDALALAFDPRDAERLTLGAAEPDPDGFRADKKGERLARLFPWAVGAAVLVFAGVAWRLLKSAPAV